jgi:hypothetical protein
MNAITRLILISVLAIFAAPAFSGQAVQVFDCEQDDDASAEDIQGLLSKWVKEVKKIKGGEELQAYLNFPAAAKMGENDFGLIIVLPSFTDWGTFRDGYKAANVAKFDVQFDDMASCPDSALWEMIEVK